MNGFMRSCLRGLVILSIVWMIPATIASAVTGDAASATSRPAPGDSPPDLLEPLEVRPVFATSQPSSAPSPALVTVSPSASPAVTTQPVLTSPSAATQPALTAPAPPPVDPLEALQERLEQIADDLSAITVCIRATQGPDGRHGTSLPAGEGPTFGGGVIVAADGLILTCEHVVRGALAVDVTLSDGRQYRARVLGVDVRADVAMLRVSAGGLTAAELCDAARLRRGHFVLAAGYPPELASGHQPAVSQGMVCAVGRSLPGAVGAADDRYYGDMIQFTAPISGGFSGGPLVDLRGRVVGLVTASESGGGGGVFGFAMPVGARLRRLIERLSTGDAIHYGWLGVAAADVDAAQARLLGLHGTSGARLHLVEHAGPADRAGLAEDDVVVALNGAGVADADGLISRAGELPPGTMATVDYIRAGQKMRTRVLVDRRAVAAPVEPPAVPVEFRGATLAAIGESLRKAANLPGDAMIVTLVRGDTPADRAGLAPGDVVVRIQGSPPSARSVAGLAEDEVDVLVGKASGGSVLIKRR